LLGSDGIPAVAGLDPNGLAGMPRFEQLATEFVGEDVMTVFRARRLAENGRPEQR